MEMDVKGVSPCPEPIPPAAGSGGCPHQRPHHRDGQPAEPAPAADSGHPERRHGGEKEDKKVTCFSPTQRKIIDESIIGRTFAIFKMQVRAVVPADTQFCDINSLSMQCGHCFLVHHGFLSNAAAKAVTATQKIVRRSTGLQQSGSRPLKGGVAIMAENLKGEVPNDKYRNALCYSVHKEMYRAE
ncbi:unnamed protein product [Bubo scandiacus]